MSRKGFIIVAAIFGAAFLLLALATRGYRKLEEMRRSAEPGPTGALPPPIGIDGSMESVPGAFSLSEWHSVKTPSRRRSDPR